MSQHFIHVRITDAPTWNKREREKEKQRWGEGEGLRQGEWGWGENPGNNKGETRDRGKADKKRDISVNSILFFFLFLVCFQGGETKQSKREG